ncbi:MAG: hypothetical protein Q8L55_15770 [Phycisphaerales bacterium]|nr:hypothetical protein [Phycisphaerales bacterium]
MWDTRAIVEAACKGLAAAERSRSVEQSPFGIESLSEAQLHPLIADALRAEGFGALREQPYPLEWVAKKGRRKPGALPDENERNRCDLVVTPRAGLRLADRLTEAKRHEAVRAKVSGTLFERHALAEAPRHDATAAGVDEVFWLEIKTAGQFTYVDGVPGPFAYGAPLVRGIGDDLKKLRDDPDVLHGGALMVLFCSGEDVAAHDIGEVASRCADKGLLSAVPAVGGFAIPDRIGNRWCGVGLFTPARGALFS